MKIKQIGLILLILIPLTTITIISCNKQKLEIDTNIRAGVSIHDGRYVFANREIFESYVNELGKLTEQQLEDIEKKLNFKSRRAIQEDLKSKAELNRVNLLATQSKNLKTSNTDLIYPNEDLYYIEDPAFASVLNEQFIVQVEDEIFNINISNGYVYVLDVENQQYLPQLEDAYLEPNTIYRYEMGLPILDILAGVDNGGDPCLVDPSFCTTSANAIEVPNRAICNIEQSFENGVCNGCAGTGHKKEQNDNQYYSTSDGNDRNRWESKIVYQPLGVWFSIISKLEHRTGAPYVSGTPASGLTYGGTVSGDSKTTIKMMNNSTYNFRRRCRDRQTGIENEGNGYSFNEKKEYRYYNGTRCLKDYCVTSRFGIYEYEGRTSYGGPFYKSTPTEWTLTLKSY